MIKYKFASGFHKPKGVSAEDAHKEIERIREKSGGLMNSKILVDESRDVNAVLHTAFEWNDTTAAELYRNKQARTLIRAIVRYEDNQPTECREYVLVVNKPETKNYVPVDIVKADAKMYEDAISTMIRQLSALMTTIKQFDALVVENPAKSEKIHRLKSLISESEGIIKEL